MPSRRWIIRIAAIFSVILLVATITIVTLSPAVAAYLCPSCYGLKRLGAGVYIEKGAKPETIADFRSTIGEAKSQVRKFYGALTSEPTLIVCVTRDCDRRLGGQGAKARAFGSTFIFVSPEGFNSTILSHEFSHIELHARIGIWRSITGTVPAWFDEGLAVIVSRDTRYLKIDASGGMRCRVKPLLDLPEDRREWRRAAGKADRSTIYAIYAMAACRTLVWLGANGGQQNFPALVDQIANSDGLFPGRENNL